MFSPLEVEGWNDGIFKNCTQRIDIESSALLCIVVTNDAAERGICSAYFLITEDWSSSPYINRFLSADTIAPRYTNPQTLNRYSYTLDNPIRYNDPSGHVVCEVGEPCGTGASYVAETSVKQMSANLRKRMKARYGITLEDGGRSWDDKDIFAVYAGMFNIDRALNGRTKSIIGSAIFRLTGHTGDGDYHGTSAPGLTTFEITSTIPNQNLYHEFGHLLNYATNNMLERRVSAEAHYVDNSYVFGGPAGTGIMSNIPGNPGYGLKYSQLSDPNYGIITDVLQHRDADPSEQWSDLFANYVAGNIDLTSNAGQEMYKFVSGTLATDE